LGKFKKQVFNAYYTPLIKETQIHMPFGGIRENLLQNR